MAAQGPVLDEPGTDQLADLVAHRVPDDGADDDHDQHEHEVHVVQRGEDPADEGGGLAGDDEAEEHGGLAEDEQTAHHVGDGPVEVLQPRPHACDQGRSPLTRVCGDQRAQGAHEALTQVRRRHAGQVMNRV